mmetsp:Transcript_77980/g.161971  ORF Transcript_77980/g.161971 Transcript_77980/m.161971 type:complete len:113 (+) Transcript_77980:376-714(+)
MYGMFGSDSSLAKGTLKGAGGCLFRDRDWTMNLAVRSSETVASMIHRLANPVLLKFARLSASKEGPDGSCPVQEQIRGVGDAVTNSSDGPFFTEVIHSISDSISDETRNFVD